MVRVRVKVRVEVVAAFLGGRLILVYTCLASNYGFRLPTAGL